ncbi:PREDICTED: NACHT, LRR and PYD domains-containing protein 12-like [Cyprinodon variegatus]|uniref:NACHT, LRR and PYD domains-containing protein 12-like n=1 Tax=Cyprinodon variegatus TaxID=28743 RepID=UPI0007425638|nr:PREDICTED: NACHT, LRR and PYD domains-containing protein 12-like [Cyprinodon variegatus]
MDQQGAECPEFEPRGLSSKPAAAKRTVQKILTGPGSSAETHLDSIFQELEIKMVTYVKNELKKIRQLLCSDSPENVGSPTKGKEVLDGVDKEKKSRSREAFLVMTQHFLRNMNQGELADLLHSKREVHQQQFKHHLKEKFQYVFEGIAKAGSPTLLNQIYTELYITEGGAGEVGGKHEVRQIETSPGKPSRPETTIRQEDLFKDQPGGDQPIRTVMTKGVAGIGKTVLTQKFTLDWAEGKAHQNIQFIFPFTFRELNVLKEKKFSLVELVHRFFTETKEICNFEDFQVLFILDGLDESRLRLDFTNTKVLNNPERSTSVDVLLTNLIRGNLLPFARLWITTRPAAANQIPPAYIDVMTDIGGFSDSQKEEYFRKRFKDEVLASRIISHVKKSRNIHIMCHIPVFCWITAVVLEDIGKTTKSRGLPQTLTEMYIHFLVVQIKVMKVKYDGGSETDSPWIPDSREMIESLGKLAFNQLQNGYLIFYESDLTDCGMDITAASVYSGVLTQVFREETGLYQEKVFCFVHLSVQEFLAALHVHLTFIKDGVNLMEKCPSQVKVPDLNNLYQSALLRALESPNGHLDLFLRFLLGLSLQSNQSLFKGLLESTTLNPENNQQAIESIKKCLGKDLSTENMLCLFHCLNEMKYGAVVEEIQQQLTSGHFFGNQPSHTEWSDLVSIILSSESNLCVFELKKYRESEEIFLMLLPVVNVSDTALLGGCDLFWRTCEALSSILSSPSCSIRELDLSNNNLGDMGVKLLCAGVKGLHCKLEIVRLSLCQLSHTSCESLSSLLSSESCKLRVLDLSSNELQDEGVKQLCVGLGSPSCPLQNLRLGLCHLSGRSCRALCTVLASRCSRLRVLDLSNNDLQDSGVKILCEGLGSPCCQLESLSLSGCLVSEEGCAALASALSSNSSHLKQLDLSYNHPGKEGVKLLSARLKDPDCELETLRAEPAGVQWLTPGLRKYSCQLTIDTNTVDKKLELSEDNRKVTYVDEFHPDDNYSRLHCTNTLTGRCYWEFDWEGDVDISVYYGEREEDCEREILEWEEVAWSLGCSADCGYSGWNSSQRSHLFFSEQPVSHRVAVYLDSSAGTLSFLNVGSDGLSHIHSFSTALSEPLRVRFNFYFCASTASSIRTLGPLC